MFRYGVGYLRFTYLRFIWEQMGIIEIHIHNILFNEKPSISILIKQIIAPLQERHWIFQRIHKVFLFVTPHLITIGILENW